MLAACQQVAAIPVKWTSLPDTHYLEHEEVTALFRALPRDSRFALRDRTLLLFLYNTGARASEVAQLRIGDLSLPREPGGDQAWVAIQGKGNKRRLCPLWASTAKELRPLIDGRARCTGGP